MPQPDDLCYTKAIDMRTLALFAVVVPCGNPGLVIKIGLCAGSKAYIKAAVET
jgi:hypothetical protein